MNWVDGDRAVAVARILKLLTVTVVVVMVEEGF
jgi:hypothetical protein